MPAQKHFHVFSIILAVFIASHAVLFISRTLRFFSNEERSTSPEVLLQQKRIISRPRPDPTGRNTPQTATWWVESQNIFNGATVSDVQIGYANNSAQIVAIENNNVVNRIASDNVFTNQIQVNPPNIPLLANHTGIRANADALYFRDWGLAGDYYPQIGIGNRSGEIQRESNVYWSGMTINKLALSSTFKAFHLDHQYAGGLATFVSPASGVTTFLSGFYNSYKVAPLNLIALDWIGVGETSSGMPLLFARRPPTINSDAYFYECTELNTGGNNECLQWQRDYNTAYEFEDCIMGADIQGEWFACIEDTSPQYPRAFMGKVGLNMLAGQDMYPEEGYGNPVSAAVADNRLFMSTTLGLYTNHVVPIPFGGGLGFNGQFIQVFTSACNPITPSLSNLDAVQGPAGEYQIIGKSGNNWHAYFYSTTSTCQTTPTPTPTSAPTMTPTGTPTTTPTQTPPPINCSTDSPGGLSPVGTIACGTTSVTFRWTNNAFRYYLVLNDTSNGWNSTQTSCSTYSGDSCSTHQYSGDSGSTKSVTPGKTYTWYVHTQEACAYTLPPSAVSLTIPLCATPTPTPMSNLFLQPKQRRR